MRRHPNAVVGGTAGVGGGVLVVWLLGLAGVALTPEVGAALAGGLAAAVLFLGRNGLTGLARIVWRGNQ